MRNFLPLLLSNIWKKTERNVLRLLVPRVGGPVYISVVAGSEILFQQNHYLPLLKQRLLPTVVDSVVTISVEVCEMNPSVMLPFTSPAKGQNVIDKLARKRGNPRKSE